MSYDPAFNGRGASFSLEAIRSNVDDHPGVIRIVVFGLDSVGTYPLGLNANKTQELLVFFGVNACGFESRDKS